MTSGPAVTDAAPCQMGSLVAVTEATTALLRDFLQEADLTVSGLDDPAVRLWVALSPEGAVLASAGFELSADGAHALIRSTAVHPSLRGSGRGSAMARLAMAQAAAAGATTAWLFSTRSGPFWQSLGCVPATTVALAAALPDTRQVQHFASSGALHSEVAWTRQLDS